MCGRKLTAAGFDEAYVKAKYEYDSVLLLRYQVAAAHGAELSIRLKSGPRHRNSPKRKMYWLENPHRSGAVPADGRIAVYL